jgi:hypothetical protein
VRVVRGPLALIFVAGCLGTGAELLLLDHTEEVFQFVPLVLLAAGCAILASVVHRAAPTRLRVFQVLMAGFVVAGISGVMLHYRSNVELELEISPEAAGLGLAWAAMKGGTPTLAPGTMVLLGAIGFVYARAASAPE